MKYTYIIIYNETSISSEGYDSFDKAEKFIEGRSYKPINIDVWLYEDALGNTYRIKEISVK